MTHAIMFHHFHGDQHLPAQGSINEEDFRKMLLHLSAHHNLLDAGEYLSRFQSGQLSERDICLTFDDALKCQYDIARPVLEEFGIKAFFFVYSSAFSDQPDKLEIFRYFRTTQFRHIDDFYDRFFAEVRDKHSHDYDQHSEKFPTLDYLSHSSYYSDNDRWFRYLRDIVLGPELYERSMEELMQDASFDIDAAKANLWMTVDELMELGHNHHSIGLHSHSHPTRMSALALDQQRAEYQANYEFLSNLLQCKIEAMSHPCGDYNKDTLKVLQELGIKIGFRSNMLKGISASALEIARQNHVYVLEELTA